MALVVAAVIGLAVGGIFFGLRGDDKRSTVATDPDNTSTSTEPPSESSSPSDTPSPETTLTADAYVYYVHDDGQSPRLYREQHHVTARVTDGRQVDRTELAVLAMLGDEPVDPDYASPWPAGTGVLSYTKDGDTATVDLTDFIKQGSEVETAGVQQLVYTITANDPSVKQARLLVQNKAPQGHSDWSAPVARAPLVEVQGLVWLLSPAQDSTVSSPVKIDGYGTATEGTISWEVRKDGVVVKQGHTQGGSNGELGDFHDTVQLPPGRYEISAFESSSKDGSPIHIDTKNFTVK
jgi:hypothetical protein